MKGSIACSAPASAANPIHEPTQRQQGRRAPADRILAGYTLSLVAAAALVGCSADHPGLGSTAVVPSVPGTTFDGHGSQGRSWMSPDAKKSGRIYVSDTVIYVYTLKGKTKKRVGEIVTPNGAGSESGSGLTEATDMTVDHKGNLWVANTYATKVSGKYVFGGDVLEYPPGATSPSKTLSDPGNGTTPVDVAVDKAGTVYALNYKSSGSGPPNIEIYAKGSVNPTQTLTASMLSAANAQGITVDQHHDIFISYTTYDGSMNYNNIGEFKPGTHGSYDFTVLVSEAYSDDFQAGDLKMDNAGNLVEAANQDTSTPSIWVYSPPNWALTKQLGPTYQSATSVSFLNRGHIWVTYGSAGKVSELAYPSGTVLNNLPGFSPSSYPRDVAVDPI